MICDTCANYAYDEDEDAYVCNIDMDEDEVVRFYTSPETECQYYRADDEYAVVRHQM
ncbi:MAG: DUF6472 family protein [Eubacteriales bacterium]|jgi:hypothetical protein|nr:DUF6472 family protein [Lachnospiraceae bacterium]MDD5860196.1 DUF6472 family protein [Eubacteriales bacterium]MCH4063048.1 DUF6472 family protein [Lachnospiraceae bacterium]MCH4104355.1 DUF6472 family protein [Lachnospiraceae bacterium]MCI1334774.1 DUF6472 family protein [Lachnospiraceae bacterium]